MNADARVFDDSISTWPLGLPYPQTPTIQTNWNKPTDDIGTLLGPSRFRLANINTSPSYEFEILFTEDECETFEAWYNIVIELGGEMYLPWIGEGRIVYLSEYELAPLGTGWKLHALAVQLYVDKDFVDRHVCDAAYVWRIPVLVDEDRDYPITLCELPGDYMRPRIIDRFFSKAANERLTDPWDTPDTFIATLTSTNVWVGNTWGHDGNPGELAMLTDTITAYLPATSLNYPIFIDIPENWMWDNYIEEWFNTGRMIYIDDWESVWLQYWVNACRLIKDVLPPPWPILDGNSMLNFAWMEKIVADMFPLETYFEMRAELPLPVLDFTVVPTEVLVGENAVLSWESRNTYALIASGGWSGTQAFFGKANTGPLWQTTSYTLTANGPGGSEMQTVTVTVLTPPAPTVTLTANPTSVETGGSSTLRWTTTNATTVLASGGWGGNLPLSGSLSTGVLPATATFTLTASGAAGTTPATTSVTVAVTVPPPPPDVFVSTVNVVALGTGVPYQYGFFLGGPTTGGVGSVTPPNLPAGGTALGRRIRAIASQQWYSLIIMCDGAPGLTQTNQFDSVSVKDVYGVVRTFTTAPQTGLTFGNDPNGYAAWWWEGSTYAIPGAGTYPVTFRKSG